MKSLIFCLFTGLAFLLASQTLAADTGPLVFEIDTANIVGESRESSKKPVIRILPDSGARCAMQVRNLDEHRAPKGYLGWHMVFTFSHPSIDDEFPTRTMNFFWDGVAFPSPFLEGFKSSYTHLDPFADFPSRYEMKFDGSSNALEFGGTDSSGLIISQFVLKLNSEKTMVESLTYQLTVFGETKTDVICTQPVKINNAQ